MTDTQKLLVEVKLRARAFKARIPRTDPRIERARSKALALVEAGIAPRDAAAQGWALVFGPEQPPANATRWARHLARQPKVPLRYGKPE